MSLYQKYRPASFDELVGQDAIADNLQAAIEKDAVTHAMIFAGGRGTGKTTTARIVAKAVGAIDFDIIEVDAASTRGIDDIREIRNGAVLAPLGKAKCYILDEAHQLTPQAWDALLKLLEEPPPRTYFILCTTNPGKVPPTVRSRCQLFTFRPAGAVELDGLLASVAKAEKIKLPAGVRAQIALHAHGSYRDGLTILDQLVGGGDLSEDALHLILGAVTAEDVYRLLMDTAQGDVAEVLATTQRLVDDGADLGRLVTSLLDMMRRVLSAKYVSDSPDADRELAAALGTDRIFQLSDSLARAAEIASRAGNTRLALEAALARAAC